MRTAPFKALRGEWSDSRFFLGKNKVMAKGIGDDPDSARHPGLTSIASDLTGNVGLLFTEKTLDEVRSGLEAFEQVDYARAGFVPDETITIKAGRLEEMPHTMAETLQQLGMPIKLDKGKVILMSDYDLCKAGVAISPEQGRLLKHFARPLATFRIHLISMWHAGKYKNLGYNGRLKLADSEGEEDSERDDGMDEDDDV